MILNVPDELGFFCFIVKRLVTAKCRNCLEEFSKELLLDVILRKVSKLLYITLNSTLSRMHKKPVVLQSNFETVKDVLSTKSDCTASCQLICLSHKLSFNPVSTVFLEDN